MLMLTLMLIVVPHAHAHAHAGSCRAEAELAQIEARQANAERNANKRGFGMSNVNERNRKQNFTNAYKNVSSAPENQKVCHMLSAVDQPLSTAQCLMLRCTLPVWPARLRQAMNLAHPTELWPLCAWSLAHHTHAWYHITVLTTRMQQAATSQLQLHSRPASNSIVSMLCKAKAHGM